ncbi:CACO2 protein, partial [Orthonyx spaldingii]|nr:CACO2 protein [Orthonyx spaldingii]
EEPPGSCVLLDRCQFSQVVFTDVEKFYVPGTDVTCHYSLTPGITPRGKDWVGIFQVGWKTTREYFTFLWAPVPAAGAVRQQLLFKAYYLPRDEEHYQFCYVDEDGAVRGASVPFQFRPEADDDIVLVTTQAEVEEVELKNQTLRRENEELREQNLGLQQQLKKTKELQETLESLRSSSERLELELNSLRTENRGLREQGGCREQELQRLKEQIQGISSDKESLEGRLRTALERLDQLQAKVSGYEKEVENLSRADQEKTKQLENLKGENQELLKTTAQHQVKPLLRQGTAPGLAQSLENLRNFRKTEMPTELKEHQGLLQALREEKDAVERENQELRDEAAALRAELNPRPAAAPGPLLFGNPYSDAGGNLGAGAEASLRTCPMCEEVFPEDLGPGPFEEHVQSHLVECPICSESFDRGQPQVFEDHVFCHVLE